VTGPLPHIGLGTGFARSLYPDGNTLDEAAASATAAFQMLANMLMGPPGRPSARVPDVEPEVIDERGPIRVRAAVGRPVLEIEQA